MLLKMITVWIIAASIAALGLPSCSPLSGSPETEALNTVTPAGQKLTTTMGDFLITSARLVEEVHGEKSAPGEKFLLVVLTQPGLPNLVPGEFSLESFQTMLQNSNNQIYVLDDDEARVISTMVGWVEDEFVMAFRVPVAESYTLYWPANSPIELIPGG